MNSKERRSLARAKGHAYWTASVQGAGAKKKIRRAEPSNNARFLRHGSSGRTRGGVFPTIPGATTPMGRKLQSARQLATIQSAKEICAEHGYASSAKITHADLSSGVSVTMPVIDEKTGLPVLKSVKIAPRCSAWVNPAGKAKHK